MVFHLLLSLLGLEFRSLLPQVVHCNGDFLVEDSFKHLDLFGKLLGFDKGHTLKGMTCNPTKVWPRKLVMVEWQASKDLLQRVLLASSRTLVLK